MIKIGRRRLLRTGAVAAALPSRVFARTSAAARPQQVFGVQSGDFSADGAIVWGRADRPARMIVDYATTESFTDSKQVEGPMAIEATDFTSRLRIDGIAPGQTVFYRVSYLDLGDYKTISAPQSGRFRTPPSAASEVTFVWSADTVGQGYGINPDLGGMTIYEAMRRLEPDFFVHSGDTIYADGPLEAERKLFDGSVWRNLVTPEKAKVAETLDEYRGNYRYNLLDDNLRRFNAEVPMLAQWDDHEVLNNWDWEKRIDDDKRYGEKSVAVLGARAQRAFREYMPLAGGLDGPMRLYRRFSYGPRLDVFRVDMRSFRGADGPNRQTAPGPDAAFLGATQVAWLKQALKSSQATWKIIAADMPLGLVVWNDFEKQAGSEAVANGEDGAPLGRELEIAGLLSFLKREGIRNVHWITGDVHYAATHHYDPDKAAFTDFEPFYEFVSGPLCAGGFGPNALDRTFGPQVVFQKAPPAGRFNLAPSEGSCHFGQVKIDGKTGELTVTHRDASGAALHTTKLTPL
jgi:alkaline phosphatase D